MRNWTNAKLFVTTQQWQQYCAQYMYVLFSFNVWKNDICTRCVWQILFRMYLQTYHLKWTVFLLFTSSVRKEENCSDFKQKFLPRKRLFQPKVHFRTWNVFSRFFSNGGWILIDCQSQVDALPLWQGNTMECRCTLRKSPYTMCSVLCCLTHLHIRQLVSITGRFITTLFLFHPPPFTTVWSLTNTPTTTTKGVDLSQLHTTSFSFWELDCRKHLTSASKPAN